MCSLLVTIEAERAFEHQHPTREHNHLNFGTPGLRCSALLATSGYIVIARKHHSIPRVDLQLSPQSPNPALVLLG